LSVQSFYPAKYMNEFDFIATLLAPLATEKGALGLKDDAAVIDVPQGFELVVTKDALTAGVHFIGDETASLIARKALRVNLSDLAAMGAEPKWYFLALMLPESVNEAWLADFAAGLKADQKEYSIALMGGDTTRSKGVLALSALTRRGAKAGDDVYVSGTVGDAALGLVVARGEERGVKYNPSTLDPRPYLLNRYQLPQPRLALGDALRGVATSCIDVSDGLMQDLGHICAASHTGAEIHWPDVPLSDAARQVLAKNENAPEIVLAGGDDYELLFTAPQSMRQKLEEGIAKATNTSITRIGLVTQTEKVKALDDRGNEIALMRTGYKHF